MPGLPINGLSEVIGIISDTVFRKIVKDRRIVTPENVTLPTSSFFSEKKQGHLFLVLAWTI